MKTKKIIYVFLFVVASIFTYGVQKTNARGIIIWGTSEKIKKIAELPDSDDYKSTNNGKFFDMGVRYTVFHIFWLPLWVTEAAKTCGYIDSDNYVELNESEIKAICEANKIDLNGKVKPAFWDSYGGKGIVIILIGLMIWTNFSKDEKEKTEDAPQAQQPQETPQA